MLTMIIDRARELIRLTSSIKTDYNGYIVNRPRLRAIDEWLCDRYVNRLDRRFAAQLEEWAA